MKPSEVSHWPEKGQFWASVRPLALIRMGVVSPEDSGVAVRWTPDADEEEMIFILPLPAGEYRFLWNTWRGPYASSVTLFVGDVWLYIDWDGTERLFFVGPETTRAEAVLHADHPMQNFSLFSTDYTGVPVAIHLYQPGFARRAPRGLTAWDHVSRDDDP